MGNYTVSVNENAPCANPSSNQFDKDAELLKIDIIADELRGSFYTLFGAYFAFLIGILGALVVVSTTVTDVATKLEWLAILPVFATAVFLYSKNTAKRHRYHIVEVDKLIERVVECHQSIGKIRDVLDTIAKQG